MDPVERLTAIRQFSKDGKRAPHKPLLILLALGRLTRTGSSALPWSEVETELGSLLNAYGLGKGGADGASYPFIRLRTDGFWKLDREVGVNDSAAALRAAPVTGRLEAGLEQALTANPAELNRAARAIVEMQFPDTLAAEVLEACGLDPESVLAAAASERVVAMTRRRDPRWRMRVLTAWDCSCAFCGFDGRLFGAPVAIEAAHVRWFNIDGPDDLDNGLALCATHHKLFDRGVIGLADPETVRVSEQFSASTESGKSVYDLHGLRLKPRPGTLLPADRHVSWHADNVFKGEPLAG